MGAGQVPAFGIQSLRSRSKLTFTRSSTFRVPSIRVGGLSPYSFMRIKCDPFTRSVPGSGSVAVPLMVIVFATPPMVSVPITVPSTPSAAFAVSYEESRNTISGWSLAFRALSMCSFIVPLPQSSRFAGTLNSTSRTAFSPVRTALTAPGPVDSTTASNDAALHSKERIVELPLIQRRLWGCIASRLLTVVQAMAAGARQSRAARARLVWPRMVVSPVLGPSRAACATSGVSLGRRAGRISRGRVEVSSGAAGPEVRESRTRPAAPSARLRREVLRRVGVRLERQHPGAHERHRALDAHQEPAGVLADVDPDHALAPVAARVLNPHLHEGRLELAGAGGDRLAPDDPHRRRAACRVEVAGEGVERVGRKGERAQEVHERELVEGCVGGALAQRTVRLLPAPLVGVDLHRFVVPRQRVALVLVEAERDHAPRVHPGHRLVHGLHRTHAGLEAEAEAVRLFASNVLRPLHRHDAFADRPQLGDADLVDQALAHLERQPALGSLSLRV